jgi:hypothetical protein
VRIEPRYLGSIVLYTAGQLRFARQSQPRHLGAHAFRFETSQIGAVRFSLSAARGCEIAAIALSIWKEERGGARSRLAGRPKED